MAFFYFWDMNKTQVLSTFEQETKIIKHLFTKVKTENLSYTPVKNALLAKPS